MALPHSRSSLRWLVGDVALHLLRYVNDEGHDGEGTGNGGDRQSDFAHITKFAEGYRPDCRTAVLIKGYPQTGSELIPSTEGPARGLREYGLHLQPADGQSRSCHKGGERLRHPRFKRDDVLPHLRFVAGMHQDGCQTDLRGMATEPNSRLSMKNRKTDATINSTNRVVGRFMPDYFISS